MRAPYRVGLLGLPWMVASQVVLPVAGPLADVFLLYLLLVGDMGMAAVILGLDVSGIDSVSSPTNDSAAVVRRPDTVRSRSSCWYVPWTPISGRNVAVASTSNAWARMTSSKAGAKASQAFLHFCTCPR